MKSFISSIIAVIIIFGASANAIAQDSEKPSPGKWMQEMRNYKYSFLAKEVGMTSEQEKKFTPLYTEMEDKIYKANKEVRTNAKTIGKNLENASDDELYNTALALSQVKVRVAEIENEYFLLFAEILDKKQMYLLKRAENRFTKELLHHNKKSKTEKQ